MLSPQAKSVKDEMFKNKAAHMEYALNTPLEKQRSDWEDSAATDVLPAGVIVDEDWVTASGADKSTAILYFHGGGGNQGSNITHRKLAARISVSTGMPVLLPNYPLAPEHPFPAALESSVNIYLRLIETFKPEKIIFGGDSSGGGLALAVMLAIKDRGYPLPKVAFLLSPMLDFTLSGETMKTNADNDPTIFEEDLILTAQCYCAGNDPANPLISPLFGGLSGFPPLLIQAGSVEVLLSDSQRLAEKAKSEGVEAILEVYEGMWHVFPAWDGIPESEHAIGKIGEFTNQRSIYDKNI